MTTVASISGARRLSSGGSTGQAYRGGSLNRMATTEGRATASPDETREIPAVSHGRLWRDRIIPKSVIGMTMLILAGAIGAAFGGVVLYSYYESRLNKTEPRVADFINGSQGPRQQAIDAINAKRDDAKAEVDKELEPIKKIQAEG